MPEIDVSQYCQNYARVTVNTASCLTCKHTTPLNLTERDTDDCNKRKELHSGFFFGGIFLGVAGLLAITHFGNTLIKRWNGVPAILTTNPLAAGAGVIPGVVPSQRSLLNFLKDHKLQVAAIGIGVLATAGGAVTAYIGETKYGRGFDFSPYPPYEDPCYKCINCDLWRLGEKGYEENCDSGINDSTVLWRYV